MIFRDFHAVSLAGSSPCSTASTRPATPVTGDGMPHVVVGGRAWFWDNGDRHRASVFVEAAVQSLSCKRILDLIAGKVVHELDIMCCSVTRLETHGGPTWFAAVSPTQRVCCDDETILVPIRGKNVQTVLLCALHLRGHTGRRFCDRRAAAMSLLAAQRVANSSGLLRADELSLKIPREIYCKETCTALVGALVPSPRRLSQQQSVAATPPTDRCCFDSLPTDLQGLVAVHCACTCSLRLPDLALVSKTFHKYAMMTRNMLALRLHDEIARCSSNGALSAGAEIACRGLWPLRVSACRHFRVDSAHGRTRACLR